MKITYDNLGERVTASIFDFTHRKLEDTQEGQLEQLYNQQQNLIDAFGRLLENLADKGQLIAPEVSTIVCGFDRHAKFEA